MWLKVKGLSESECGGDFWHLILREHGQDLWHRILCYVKYSAEHGLV